MIGVVTVSALVGLMVGMHIRLWIDDSEVVKQYEQAYQLGHYHGSEGISITKSGGTDSDE